MRTSEPSPPAARRVLAAGVETHVYDVGAGEVPVVCVHGNPDSADAWLPLLSRADVLVRVIAPDLPGFGRSERPSPERFAADVDAYVTWFAALLDELRIDRYRLVVHDWGSLALAAAARHPERVERLVAIDVVPLSGDYRWHWIARYLWRPPLLAEAGMLVFGRFTIKLLTRLQRPRLKALDAGLLDRIARDLDPGMKRTILRLYRSADPDVLARHGRSLAALRCPALIVWDEQDPYVGIAEMTRLQTALGGPVQTLAVTGGHWPQLDTDAVFDAAITFLTRSGDPA